jgi:cytochrome c-type biogenesis protein CcmH/NrfG
MRLALVGALVVAVACAQPTPVDRALAMVRQHKDPDAIALLREELVAHPDDLPARKLLIRVLANEGDLGAARDEVDELAKRAPPGDPSPWIELGHAYELVHKFDEALAAYDEAAVRAPDSPLGPREGGMRCARWGEAEEARSRLEEAVKRGSHDAETLHALGLVRVHLHDLPGAALAYREGLKADPDSRENLLGLATVAVLSNDPASALVAYDALLSKVPTFAPAELGRAWALAKLGKKSDAEKALDHATELGAPAAEVDKQRQALRAP